VRPYPAIGGTVADGVIGREVWAVAGCSKRRVVTKHGRSAARRIASRHARAAGVGVASPDFRRPSQGQALGNHSEIRAAIQGRRPQATRFPLTISRHRRRRPKLINSIDDGRARIVQSVD